jgi:hypothetical protein
MTTGGYQLLAAGCLMPTVVPLLVRGRARAPRDAGRGSPWLSA